VYGWSVAVLWCRLLLRCARSWALLNTRTQTQRPHRRKHAAYKELSQRVERHASLSKLATRMEAQKAVMTGHGRKKKVAGATADAPAVFKWKQERKR